MAKKASTTAADRKDPKQNKSLAIRMVLSDMKGAKAKDIVAAVKQKFGHDIQENQVYMVKTKLNKKSAGRRGRRQAAEPAAAGNGKLSSRQQWVEAIRAAKQLLDAAGDVPSATALLKAVAD
jgi:hypothetical protein